MAARLSLHDASTVATICASAIETPLALNRADFQRFTDRIAVLTPDTTFQDWN